MILQVIQKSNLLGRFYASNWGKKWIDNKLKSVLPHLDKNSKLLDLGCGNGLISQKLQQEGFECTPIDLANLSIVPNMAVVIYDGISIPFEDKYFDTTLLLTVLHHTSDPLLVLTESARVAKKIIIIEDVYSNKIQQYLTYLMDTIVNLGHSKMTYQNKSDLEWKQTFKNLNLELVAESSQSILFFFRQATYVLTTS